MSIFHRGHGVAVADELCAKAAKRRGSELAVLASLSPFLAE